MWTNIAIWLATTRTGRFVAAAGALAVAIGVALLKAFGAGKQIERAKQDRQSLENLRHRAKVEDAIDTLSQPTRKERLDRWAKD